MSKVIVTGVSGQDGSIMVEYLLNNTDHEIVGTVRRTSQINDKNYIKFQEDKRFRLGFCDLSDCHSITELIKEEQPDYFINFGGCAFVPDSWNSPEYTMQVNAIAIIHILEAIRKFKPKCRFYNASSSEIFGDVKESPQTINTIPSPRSIYGVSKNAAREITKVYRESYNLYAVSGILFNHESSARALHYVSRKISTEVGRIVKEMERGEIPKPLEIGNINAKRDWSHAEDFISGIWAILNQEEYLNSTFSKKYNGCAGICFAEEWLPKDYVLSSGETNTVREFIDRSFELFEIYANWHGSGLDEKLIWKEHKCGGEVVLVKINPEFYRPNEVDLLLGDSTPAREELGWSPKITFDKLVEDMVMSDYNAQKIN
jgi:GDPmannose 4,6-dehydratase